MWDPGDFLQLPPGADLAVEGTDHGSTPPGVVDAAAHCGACRLGKVGLEVSCLPARRQEFVQCFALFGRQIVSHGNSVPCSARATIDTPQRRVPPLTRAGCGTCRLDRKALTMQNVTIVESLPRPNRLNAAGWCLYCSEWRCEDVRCIRIYERTHWGLCADCYGDQHATEQGWCLCSDGLTEYASHEDAVRSFDQLIEVAARRRGEAWRERMGA